MGAVNVGVKVRLFAGAADVAGARLLPEAVEPGTTVGQLAERLAGRYPQLQPLLKTAVWAVNWEYAAGDRVLEEGDEVALVPPVSGGSEGDFRLTDEPLSVDAVLARVAHPDAGAVVIFLGTVREHTGDLRTEALEYDAYRGMAERKMAEVADEAGEKWPGVRLAIVHRLGRVGIGEASVIIAASSPHRPEAFAACRHAIERIKEFVPIWKKELWAGGATAWVGDDTAAGDGAAARAGDGGRGSGAIG